MTDLMIKMISLPGTDLESAYLYVVLRRLSYIEEFMFAAAVKHQEPKTMADAINCYCSMGQYEVCYPAKNYEELGKFYLAHHTQLPPSVYPFANMQQIGMDFERECPGWFIGNCYVKQPLEVPQPAYDGETLPEDYSWNVRLRLSSRTVDDTIWIRIPGYEYEDICQPNEIEMAMEYLHVKSIDDCMLIESVCSMRGVEGVHYEYARLSELVDAAQHLGSLLNAGMQKDPLYISKLFQAMDFENCVSLREVLDIVANFDQYSFVTDEELYNIGYRHCGDYGVSDEELESCHINFRAYGRHILKEKGFVLTRDGTAYILREGEGLKQSGIQMTM